MSIEAPVSCLFGELHDHHFTRVIRKYAGAIRFQSVKSYIHFILLGIIRI